MGALKLRAAVGLSIWISLSLGCSDHGIKIHEDPPTASLLSPSDNTPFLEGQSVAFEVQLDDNDDGVDSLDVAWHSDALGTLRGDATLSDDGIQTFVTSELSRGDHTVTVTATDPDGNKATDDVLIKMRPNTDPGVHIETASHDTDDGDYAEGGEAVINATVWDDEQSVEELRLSWTLNGSPRTDAPDRTDATATTSWTIADLEPGTYTVIATVADPLGATQTSEATIVVIPLDGDGDGQTTGELGGEDCDDTDPDIGPGSAEVCDGIDNDCDGLVDAEDDDLVEADYDEVCDGIDNDCDGLVDAEDDDIVDAITGYPDADGDGFGDSSASIFTCDPDDLAEEGGDCNDLDDSVNPDAEEICGDGLDNDCDGTSGPCKWTGDQLVTSSNHTSFGVGNDDGIASSLAGGDLNGDGYDDLIIGADNYGSETDDGGVFIVAGPLEETVGGIDEHATGIITGTEPGGLAGAAVVTSDVDSDGGTDLIIGAPAVTVSGIGANVGRVYIFAHGTLEETSVDSADTIITGETIGDRFGAQLSSGGDLDGDGLEDVVMTSVGDGTYAAHAGSVSVFLGGDVPWGSSISVADRSAHIASNENENEFGFSTSLVGDVNGDGRDDLLVGAPGAKVHGTNTGAAFLFLGHATNFATGASRLQTTANATYTGVDERNLAGSAVTGLGDIDGDGYTEFAISAPKNSDYNSSSGAVYIMIDPDRSGTHDLNDHADVVLHGALSTNRIGESLVGQIDLDNDGVSDLVIGAPQTDVGGSSHGKAFLIYGPLTDLEDGLLGEEDGIEDGAFVGENNRDRAGEITLGGYDWTGDGIADLAVTAPGTESLSGVSDAGGVFVFFGRGM